MQFRNVLVLSCASLAVAVMVGASGCSSNSDKSTDAATDSPISSKDTGTTKDTGTQPDSGGCTGAVSCEMCDVSGYTPTPQSTPTQTLHSCSTAQMTAFVTACFGGSQSACTAWQQMDSGACGTCLAGSSQSDATWGALVCGTQTCSLNSPGCVDILLKQTADESSAGGKGSCGDLIEANFGCQDYVCSSCTAGSADATTCGNDSVSKECVTYVNAQESGAPCAALNGDATIPADACFPQTDADAVNVLDVFCGTGTGVPN